MGFTRQASIATRLAPARAAVVTSVTGERGAGLVAPEALLLSFIGTALTFKPTALTISRSWIADHDGTGARALAQVLQSWSVVNQPALTSEARRNLSTVVHWEFARGRHRLSCQIKRRGGAFQVAVVPYRQVQQASIETFQAAVAALARHAMLASRLRSRGWKLVSYTT